MWTIGAIFLYCWIFTGFLEVNVVSFNTCTVSWCDINEDSLKFFIIGDWGGIPIWPYISLAQTRVAKSMGEMAQVQNGHYQISVGDNFYTHGVQNADDDRFQETFEDVYTNPALRTPWYITGGNHDHYGNITGEIAYTKKSNRWVFPELFYTVKYRLPDGTTVETVMIDTIALCGNLKPDTNMEFSVWSSLFGTETPSTEQPVLKASERASAERHWEWLEERLRTSRSNYLFVAGHFPVYSVGDHGPTVCLVDRLLPLLSQYRVSAYLNGHDHNLQHLQVNSSGTQMNFVISGSGGYLDSSQIHKEAVPAGSLKFMYPDSGADSVITKFLNYGGFVCSNVNRNRARFRYYKGTKNLLYQFSVAPRVFKTIV